jgi:hypothetical protein
MMLHAGHVVCTTGWAVTSKSKKRLRLRALKLAEPTVVV